MKEIKIEQLDVKDKDFLRHVYGIRKRVFENFPRQDRMVYNEWDALSKHFMAVVNGQPAGSIAVVDWTGLADVLQERGIDTNIRVGKVTKLAILPEYRSIQTLKSLVNATKIEQGNYDFAVAEMFAPSNNPNDADWHRKGKRYQEIFGLDLINETDVEGIPTQIFGRKIK
jgi:hypothetical protein